jgi:tetratricopeptide (TPR) repeat protein
MWLEDLPMSEGTDRMERVAEEHLSTYRWLEAGEAYDRAAEQARRGGDLFAAVLLGRESAFCHLRLAFQSADRLSFLSKVKSTESAYLRCSKSARSLSQGSLRLAFSSQLKGRLCFVRSLHSTGARERQYLLRQNSQLQREAMVHFANLEDRKREGLASSATLEYLEALSGELELEWSPARRRAIIAAGIDAGMQALRKRRSISSSPSSSSAVYDDDDDGLSAWLHFHLGTLMHRQVYLLDDDAAMERKKLSIDHIAKALELSTHGTDLFLKSRAHLAAISAIGYGARSPGVFRDHISASLETASTTGDSRLIADALAAAAYDLTWEMVSEEIPERRTTRFEECKRLVEEAVKRYDAICCAEGRAAASGVALVLAYYRASFAVADRSARAELLEEAAEIGEAALEKFVRSGSIGFAGPLDNTPAQNLAFVLIQQAHHLAAEDENKKRKLFARAARLSREASRYRESFEPFNSWDRGIDLDTEASIQVELSRIGVQQQRADILRAAAAREREAMKLCRLHFARSPSVPRTIAVSMGAISNRVYNAYRELYELTGEGEARAAMMAALREMAALYEKGGWPSRAAQAHWRMGKQLDREGSYVEASDEFEAASRLFDVAAKDITQFGEYFTEYSYYMKAWCLICRARSRTALQSYEEASVDYASASELLRGTRRWRDASDYFTAWSRLQAAEAHSAREQFSDAIRALEDARDLFSRSERASDHEADLPMITVVERLDISRHASIRKRYCEGRAALETARKIDVEGEEEAEEGEEEEEDGVGENEKKKVSRSSSSFLQYGVAASIFREIGDSAEPGREEDEFKSMSMLCQGWKFLKEGETNYSGALFAQAARSFEEASRLRITERISFVATASSHYCDAMREGIEFGKTGDTATYSRAKNHMEAARSGYEEAELHRNAIWTEAAMAILDARLYLFRGEATEDPVERARYYEMTERSLGSALSLADDAGYRSRMLRVGRELSRLQRRSKVVHDLARMITAPPVTTPGDLVQAQPKEEAHGVSAFEGVNLQGQLRHERQVEVGETFDVQLDVFNTGSRSASLLKVEEMASSDLRLVAAQEPYLIEEETSLDTKQRLIQPLRIQSFRVSILAENAGEKVFSPRLVYRDDTGRVNVLPVLGTSVSVLPTSVFEFRSPEAGIIFESLVKVFVSDYMHDRLSPEQSGWRTRGRLEKECGVSKSALYEAPGRYGSPLYELLSRGLVEARTFRGQRGRGGETTKLRIAYDKDTVKRYVDRWVKKKKKER